MMSTGEATFASFQRRKMTAQEFGDHRPAASLKSDALTQPGHPAGFRRFRGASPADT